MEVSRGRVLGDRRCYDGVLSSGRRSGVDAVAGTLLITSGVMAAIIGIPVCVPSKDGDGSWLMVPSAS